MGLQHITDDGELLWHCHTDDCPPLQEHISHDLVEWIEPGLVALPPCPGCGSRCFVRTQFTEAELRPPIITRNEDGSIKSVEVRGAPNFTHISYEVHKHQVPHPEKPDMMIDAFSLLVTDVQPHPMIARHQKLHQLLHQHGKPAPQKAS